MALRFVDTEESLRTLLPRVKSCLHEQSYVYVDIEGHKLGRFGTLDLIQLYVKPLGEIFVIDVFRLQEKAFTTSSKGFSLKTLFESPKWSKVFFDVRNDSDALCCHFGIALQGVVDLQLMEYFQPGRTGRNLLGLQACVTQHSQLGVNEIEQWTEVKKTVAKLFTSSNEYQRPPSQQRPLPKLLLDYATGDVLHMPRLFGNYRRNLSKQSWEVVQYESQKRIRSSQQPNYDPHGKNKWKGPYRRNGGHRNQPARLPTTPSTQTVGRTSTSGHTSRRRNQQNTNTSQERTIPRSQTAVNTSREHDAFVGTIICQFPSISLGNELPDHNDKSASDKDTVRHQPRTFLPTGRSLNRPTRKQQPKVPAFWNDNAFSDEDLDWTLCDKDCGWCGKCYGSCGLDI